MEHMKSEVGVSPSNPYDTLTRAANASKADKQYSASQDLGIVDNYDPDKRKFLSPALQNMIGVTIPQGSGVVGTLVYNNDYGPDLRNPDDPFTQNLGKGGGTRAKSDFERSSRYGGGFYPVKIKDVMGTTNPDDYPFPFTGLSPDGMVIIRETWNHRREPLAWMDTPLSVTPGQPITLNRTPTLGGNAYTNYTSGGKRTEHRDYIVHKVSNSLLIYDNRLIGSFPYFSADWQDTSPTFTDYVLPQLGVVIYQNRDSGSQASNGEDRKIMEPNTSLGFEFYGALRNSDNSNDESVLLRTVTAGIKVVELGSSYCTIILRPDICVGVNPDTGFFNIEGNPPDAEALGTSLFQAWEFNSPLPPGARYLELGDFQPQQYPYYHPKNNYGPFLDNALGYPLFELLFNKGPNGEKYENIKFLPVQDGTVRSFYWIRKNYGWDTKVYSYNYSNYDWERATKTVSAGATVVSNDSFWTGTCSDPLNWHDPLWSEFINYDKLALYLKDHPDCVLGS